MCLGIPGELLEVHDVKGLKFGKVRFGGITRDVCLEYALDAVPGDYVVVHVGFAISKVQEDEARRTYDTLREMSQLDELDWMRETADLGLAAFASREGHTAPGNGGDA